MKYVRKKENEEMLILTRKKEECVMIGDDIKIKVVQIKGKEVKLGITAPEGLSVHREEIYWKIHEKIL